MMTAGDTDETIMENKGTGLSNETTQAHGPNKRPCACTQNMGLS